MQLLKISERKCEEANMLGVMVPGEHGPEPAPCGNPATNLIWHGRNERPYYMCMACAYHNVHNRNGISLIQQPGFLG